MLPIQIHILDASDRWKGHSLPYQYRLFMSHTGRYMVHPNETRLMTICSVLYTEVFTLLNSWECRGTPTWSSAWVGIITGLTRFFEYTSRRVLDGRGLRIKKICNEYDADWMMGLSTKRVPAAAETRRSPMKKNIKGSHECYFTWLMSYDVAETETQKREKAALLAYNCHYGRK